MKKSFLVLGMLSTAFVFGQNEKKAQPKLIFTPSYGFGWRTAKVTNSGNNLVNNHINASRSGSNFGISAYYKLNNRHAIGLKYNNFHSNENSWSLQSTTNISFIGPSFMFSNFDDNKHKLSGSIALGRIGLNQKISGVLFNSSSNSSYYINNDIKGSNLGMDVDFSYQYQFTKHFSVGPQINYTMGVLSNATINGKNQNFKDSEKESLYNLGLKLNVSFHF